ncbi:MAG TPA: protease complex subunit PrcB family protein [Gemmatimonadaceae bacterium]
MKFGLWLLVGVAACQSAGMHAQPSISGRLPITRLRNQAGSFDSNSGLVDSARVVVRDAATWRTLWGQINQPFIPQPAVPSIDFNRDMVVVAAMGTKPSGGYDIMIEGVTEDSSGVEISVVRSSPGNGCALTAARTQPVDLARIPATPRPVRFRERSVVVPCGGS